MGVSLQRKPGLAAGGAPADEIDGVCITHLGRGVALADDDVGAPPARPRRRRDGLALHQLVQVPGAPGRVGVALAARAEQTAAAVVPSGSSNGRLPLGAAGWAGAHACRLTSKSRAVQGTGAARPT